MFFGNVGNKDGIYATIGSCIEIMAIVIDPADRLILADDPVFRIIHMVIIFFYLFIDRSTDPFIIFRMDHSLEGITGQFLEFIQTPAAKDRKNRSVGIDQFFIASGTIDEKTSRHMSAEFFDDRKSLFIQFKTII